MECQFKSLQSCPRSEYHLDHLLKSLPQSLDETYERMLCNIDSYLIEEARRILSLLCFATRPLTVYELIDGIAVDTTNTVGLSRKRRSQDANDIRGICSGLIDISLTTLSTTEASHEDLTPTVRIAHFSVQEYLESERIRYQKAAIFGLSSATAHAVISQICLVYLLEPALSCSKLSQTVLEEYPLAHFAAMYWYHHYQQAKCTSIELLGVALKLFQRQDLLTTWVRLHDIDCPWETSVDFDRTSDDIASSVYYVSLLGLGQVLYKLINIEQHESRPTTVTPLPHTSSIFELINAQGGDFDNALQAASHEGYQSVVQLLLEKGADVNTQGGYYGNALQAASFGGHQSVVQLLVKKGAGVNQKDVQGRTPIHLASAGGQLLLLFLSQFKRTLISTVF